MSITFCPIDMWNRRVDAIDTSELDIDMLPMEPVVCP